MAKTTRPAANGARIETLTRITQRGKREFSWRIRGANGLIIARSPQWYSRKIDRERSLELTQEAKADE